MAHQKPSRALRTTIALGLVLVTVALIYLRVIVQPQNEAAQRLTLEGIETWVRETRTIDDTLTAIYSP